MKFRPRYPFDPAYPSLASANPALLAATPDRRTWWYVAGARGGVRVLAHYADDGAVYTAGRLHAECLSAACDSDISPVLRRAADMLPITEMIVPHLVGTDWTLDILGFLPCPRIPGEIPAIIPHRQGWRTRTERVLPLPAPAWADAQAYDLREGVYLVLADGSSRLMSRRHYYGLDRLPEAIEWILTPLRVHRADDPGGSAAT